MALRILSHPRARRYALFLAAAYLTFVGGTLTTDFRAGTRVVYHAVMTLGLGVWLVGRIRRRDFPATALDGPFLVLFAVYALATVFAVDPRVSVEVLWRIFVHILLFYAIVDLARRHGARTVLEPVYLVAGVVVVVGFVELAAWYFGLSFLPVGGQSWWEIGGLNNPIPPTLHRPTIPLNVSTWLAAYLAMLIPPALAVALSTRTRDVQQGFALWIVGAFVLEVATLSRGGLLSLAVSLPLFGGLILLGSPQMRERLSAPRVWVPLGAAVAVAIAAGGLAMKARFAHAAEDVNSERLDLWRSGVLIGLDNPITGVGPYGYGRALRSYRDPTVTRDHLTAPHNVALLAWSEAGLPGVLAYALLAATAAWAGFRRWRAASGAERVRVSGMIAGLVGFAAQNMVDNFSYLLVLLPAMGLLALIVHRQPGVATEDKRLKRTIPAALLVITLIGGLGWAASDAAQLRFSRALRLAWEGGLPAAVEELDAAHRIDPAMGMYVAQRAYYLGVLATDDPAIRPAALVAQEEALALDPTYDVGYADAAMLAFEGGDARRAADEMARAVAIEPEEAIYWLWLGQFREALGEDGAAGAAYADALDLAPVWAVSPFWDETAIREEVREAYLEAHGLADIPLDGLSGLPPECWDAAGGSLVGEYESAAQEMACEGEVALRLEGDPVGALARFDEALEANSRLGEAYVGRAEARLVMGDEAEAERDALTGRFLSSRRANFVLGQIEEARGDLDAAERAYMRGGPLRLDPSGYEVAVYYRQGQLDLLPGLIAPGPGAYALESWEALARLYEEQGRVEEADEVRARIDAWEPYRAASQPQP
jgi:O-antigen ligase/tetratricopeptide (TPR) repeat protein